MQDNSAITTMDGDNGASNPRRRGFLSAAAGVALGAVASASAFAAGTAPNKAANKAADGVLDVVIIGGGLAGLTAARDLRLAGCESFAILEARDRVGGRTLNHDLGNGHFSEAGGQWIGPGQTAVADLARELEVGTFPTYYQGKTVLLAGGAQVAADLDGSFATDPQLTGELEALARTVPSGAPWKAPHAAELDKLSLGDWLAKKSIKPEDQIGWTLGSMLSGGAAPAKLSLLYYLSMINSAGSYEGLEATKGGAQETRLVGGSQILCLKMAEALHDKLHLSTPVSKIAQWDQAVVSVHTPGGVLRARRVIVALSPSLCNQVEFDPPLPADRRDLQSHWPAYAPARKTTHVYSKPFWRARGYSGWIVQADGPVMWAYDNSPQDASIGVINAFVLQSMLPSDPDQAKTTLAEIYAQALGEEALHPIGYHERDWGTADRWTLSCVSPIPPGFWTRFGKALHPPVGRLIWSGTETADIWAGYMDGAIRSGHRAALQALGGLGGEAA